MENHMEYPYENKIKMFSIKAPPKFQLECCTEAATGTKGAMGSLAKGFSI